MIRDRKTLTLKSNVTHLDAKVRRLTEYCNEVQETSACLVIVAVDEKGEPTIHVPEEIPHVQDIICAVRECLFDLELRYSLDRGEPE